MMIQEASKWDIRTYVLDEDKQCPAGSIASVFVKGSRLKPDDVYHFGKQVDVLTFEIESIDTTALHQLSAEGIKVRPEPSVLELIQDKGRQKEFYAQRGIPTSPFRLVADRDQVEQELASGSIRYPFVQKLRKGGYDGQGVAIIRGKDDLDRLLAGPSVIEELVDIDKEISVIAARNERGEVKCYPVVEMSFDKLAHLVEKLICPASIGKEQEVKAMEIAGKLVDSLRITGLLAVEFFIDRKGEVLVNEISPRPHNSGHHTFESAITSQFEQHLRAILNLPLGSTRLKMPSVMINLLGEPGFEGQVKYEGLTESMAIEGVKVHLYGKKITRPFRKMGHVTVLAPSVEEALAKADKVKELIKVKS
jgi:5-(carboxyamino)imidazole ribonucleotide synthase